jgi:hypothetical protein
MGHADIQTTMRYLHYAPHAEDAALVAEAFRTEDLDGGTSVDKSGHLGTTSCYRDHWEWRTNVVRADRRSQ